MRTKTLLIAAAAIAAGIISSQAQTYSQNIVGYINQQLPAGVYTLISAPLQATTANTAEDLLPALQGGDTILIWDKVGQTYDAYTYFGPGTWQYPDSSFGAAPTITVGTGIFYANGQTGPETNTCSGTVVLGQTNTLGAGIYQLIASAPPIGGTLESTNLNLPLQGGDTVLLWDQTGQTYDAYTYFGPGLWQYPDSSFNTAPSIVAGQGFFYANGQTGSEQWVQNLVVP